MKPKIIAIDFDGTLCENAWPDIGKPNYGLMETVRAYQRLGLAKFILWTCREGEKLEEAVEWCAQYGLHFDAVNENLEETRAQYGRESRKVTADEYWDDRAVVIRFGGAT